MSVWVHAANTTAWAIGKPQRNGFHVRRVVWGMTLAKEERRPDEQIRLAKIMVEKEWKSRRLPKKRRADVVIAFPST